MTPISTDPASPPSPIISANPLASTDPLIWAKVRRIAKFLPHVAYQRFVKLSLSHFDPSLSKMENIAAHLLLVVNQTEGGQEPILHDAVRHKRSAKDVADLLFAGANPNQLNRQGQTALDVAIESDAVEIAQLLIRNGAEASSKKKLEVWVKSKPSGVVEAFLHAGFIPTSSPPRDFPMSIRVFWASSSIELIRAELILMMSDLITMHEFLNELAHQRRDDPLFQAMASLVESPLVICLGFGVISHCPILNASSWNFLNRCLETKLITVKFLIQSIQEPQIIQFYMAALEALPEEDPTGMVSPFYDRYTLKIKHQLFGTLWNPKEELLALMAEKLKWHPEEWHFIQSEYLTHFLPKSFLHVIDRTLKYYLRGIKLLDQDEVAAKNYLRKAANKQLARACIDLGILRIEQRDFQEGFALLKSHAHRGIILACRTVALSANISIETIKTEFNIHSITALLDGAEEPSGSILHARYLVSSDVDESLKQEHIVRLWSTPFRGEVLAKLQTLQQIHSIDEIDHTILSEAAAAMVMVALANLAQNSIPDAEHLVDLAKNGNEAAKSFAIQLFLHRNCIVSPIVKQVLHKIVPLTWILIEEKFDLIEVFREEDAPYLSVMSDMVTRWDSETRQSQVRLFQEYLPENQLKEILEERTKEISFENLDYLYDLYFLLPLLVEASPSIDGYIRAYKMVLFKDPLRWKELETLNWVPCTIEEREVLPDMGLKNLYRRFPRSDQKNWLPGHSRYLRASVDLREGRKDKAKQTLQKSFDRGFNPAGIRLAALLLEEGDAKNTLWVFQKLIQQGAYAAYSIFPDACVELLGRKKATARELEKGISSLDFSLVHDVAVTPEELCLFFRWLHSPTEVTDKKFFEIAEKLEKNCSVANWQRLLEMIDQSDSLPILLKMQLYLVGNEPADYISRLPKKINSKEWIEYLKNARSICQRNFYQLEFLTVTYILESENEACDHLLVHLKAWMICLWVNEEGLDGEITDENVAKAEFFWRELKRILEFWKEGISKRSNIREIHSLLKKQSGLAQSNRLYRKCLRMLHDARLN